MTLIYGFIYFNDAEYTWESIGLAEDCAVWLAMIRHTCVLSIYDTVLTGGLI